MQVLATRFMPSRIISLCHPPMLGPRLFLEGFCQVAKEVINQKKIWPTWLHTKLSKQGKKGLILYSLLLTGTCHKNLEICNFLLFGNLMNLGHFIHEKSFVQVRIIFSSSNFKAQGLPLHGIECLEYVCMEQHLLLVFSQVQFTCFRSPLCHIPRQIMIQGPHYQVANSTLLLCQIAESTSSYGVHGRVSSCPQISNFLGCCSRLECFISCAQTFAQKFQTAPPLPLPPSLPPSPRLPFSSSFHRTPLSKSLPLLGPAQKVVQVEKKSPFQGSLWIGGYYPKIQEEPVQYPKPYQVK